MEAMTITPNAAKRITALREKEGGGKDMNLRITVLGGGCSGFHYEFQMDDTVNADDFTFDRDGAGVVTDATSMRFLQGAELDYVQDMIKSAFRIRNPNAAAACGCGNSFSL